MKTPQIIFFLLTLITSIHALALPTSLEAASHLFKRKGGGGGGGRGGGSSSSSSGGSRSGSSSSGGSRSGGVAGVGPQPRAYAGGSYYGGGSASPYPAGRTSPSGVNPRLVPAAGLAFLGGGALLYGAYLYPYGGYYRYYNQSAGENQTRTAECYCGRYSDCGCDARNETDFVNSVANNQSIARVADVNGTDTLLIDGTLPNGTTVAQESKATALSAGLGQFGGWAIIGGAVAWGVWLM